MQEFISDWFIPMDFGNDMPDEEPDGEDNFRFIFFVNFMPSRSVKIGRQTGGWRKWQTLIKM